MKGTGYFGDFTLGSYHTATESHLLPVRTFILRGIPGMEA